MLTADSNAGFAADFEASLMPWPITHLFNCGLLRLQDYHGAISREAAILGTERDFNGRLPLGWPLLLFVRRIYPNLVLLLPADQCKT